MILEIPATIFRLTGVLPRIFTVWYSLCRMGSPLSVNFTQRRVVLRGREVSLTPIEYELLKVFLTHRGKILTRQMLLAQVWGTGAHASTHSLHVYVAQLRRKIELDLGQLRLIFTIPGVGCRFTDAEESEAVFRATEPETKRRWCSLLGLPAFR